MMRMHVKAVVTDAAGTEVEVEIEVAPGGYAWNGGERIVRGENDLGRYEFLAPPGFEPFRFERRKGARA